MLDMARKADDLLSGKTRAMYDADEPLRLALVYLIQTTGEAARKVSPEFKAAHPEIPWAKITGIRHRIVHDYLHVDYDIVWDVVTANLPELIRDLAKAVPPATA
jgi:uncharacterized protein with HEPN domain